MKIFSTITNKYSGIPSGKAHYPGFRAVAILSIAISTFLLIWAGCEKEHQDLIGPDDTVFPAAPHNMRALIDNGKIALSWDIANGTSIRSYRVYRSDSLNLKMNLLDSTTARQYVDQNLHNGQLYSYQISAVNKQGYEGKKSAVVLARANIFSIIINGGDEYTNQRAAALNITAPVGTKYMQVAQDSLFANATWEPFMSHKNWTLTAGDGKKYVYSRFQDAEGNETHRPIGDSITLDTKAVITEVRENTSGQTRVPGQTIHFSIVTGEPDGSATIDIGDTVTGIKLYDDGTNGDAQANNGTYEVDYRIPLGLQVLKAIVSGHFTDRANNVANVATANGRVTIQQDPLAVTLYPPAVSGTDKKVLDLYWSPNTDESFACYRLYRATQSGVDTASNLITMISSSTTTYFQDEDVKVGVNYFYRIFVFDKFGKAKGSNEVMGKIDDEKPKPVMLYSPTPVVNSLTSLQLQWSKNEDGDFESYRLYRSEAPKAVDSTSYLVTTISDQNTLTFEDTDLKPNTEYNYQLYVFDAQGNMAGSNKVKGKTNANVAPTAVTLLTPVAPSNSYTTLNLSWSQNGDSDFESYRLYRSSAAGVDTSDQWVTTIGEHATTHYEDTGLQENTKYYYRLYVYDTGGLSAASNEVKGQTNENAPPGAVTLNVPSPIANSTSSLHLSWSQSRDDDFYCYKIYRSDSAGVSNTKSLLITTISERETGSFDDTNLKQNTSYFYRVYVYDLGGKATASNEASGKTNSNDPPTAVILAQPTVEDSVTLKLSWSENRDADFSQYIIYRSITSPVKTTDAPIAIISNQSTTEYFDANLTKNTTYFYQVIVMDKDGLTSASNQVSGTPKP